EDVALVLLRALELAGARGAEALLGARLRFHLGHEGRYHAQARRKIKSQEGDERRPGSTPPPGLASAPPRRRPGGASSRAPDLRSGPRPGFVPAASRLRSGFVPAPGSGQSRCSGGGLGARAPSPGGAAWAGAAPTAAAGRGASRATSLARRTTPALGPRIMIIRLPSRLGRTSTPAMSEVASTTRLRTASPVSGCVISRPRKTMTSRHLFPSSRNRRTCLILNSMSCCSVFGRNLISFSSIEIGRAHV